MILYLIIHFHKKDFYTYCQGIKVESNTNKLWK